MCASQVASWLAEDLVSADAAPNNVRLTWPNLFTVLPRGAAVGGKRHLPYASGALDPLDSQTRSKLA